MDKQDGEQTRKPVHKGWYSRGYLPHCDEPGQIQMITYRLFDSLPEGALSRMIQEHKNDTKGERSRRIDKHLDAGYGACFLAIPGVAEIVEENLMHFDGERYRLIAWVIMPNHVHLVAEMFDSEPLEKLVHSWKSYTSTKANKLLGRVGKFWHPDYFDRYMRNFEHMEKAVNYVEYNPVKAGLAITTEEWRWGSAWHRKRDG